MGHQHSNMSEENIKRLRDLVGVGNLKLSWSNRYLNEIFKGGWKLCTTCRYLIFDRAIKICPVCGQRYRLKCRRSKYR